MTVQEVRLTLRPVEILEGQLAYEAVEHEPVEFKMWLSGAPEQPVQKVTRHLYQVHDVRTLDGTYQKYAVRVDDNWLVDEIIAIQKEQLAAMLADILKAKEKETLDRIAQAKADQLAEFRAWPMLKRLFKLF